MLCYVNNETDRSQCCRNKSSIRAQNDINYSVPFTCILLIFVKFEPPLLVKGMRKIGCTVLFCNCYLPFRTIKFDISHHSDVSLNLIIRMSQRGNDFQERPTCLRHAFRFVPNHFPIRRSKRSFNDNVVFDFRGRYRHCTSLLLLTQSQLLLIISLLHIISCNLKPFAPLSRPSNNNVYGVWKGEVQGREREIQYSLFSSATPDSTINPFTGTLSIYRKCEYSIDIKDVMALMTQI